MIYAIVVTYNGVTWIEKCFNSLLSSNIKLKIIAIDNSSNDGTTIIIRQKFPSIELIELPENIGFGKANNIGINKAMNDGADYVFLLNQDAWIESDAVQYLVDQHRKNPEYGVLSPFQLNGSNTEIEQGFIHYISPIYCKGLISDLYFNKTIDNIYEVTFVNAASWLISRECLLKLKGFDPLFFHYGEDNNFVHRLKYAGFKIGVCPQVRIYHDRIPFREKIFFTKREIVIERNFKIILTNPNVSNPEKIIKKEIFQRLLYTSFVLNIRQLKDTLSMYFIFQKTKRQIYKNRESRLYYYSFLIK
ncbi:MAG: glycosyltransferase family 2 protein [Ignavibacteriales bacterium]|jgi:GT2 family glycosyltransferase|nr:MAG: glycosyltransferase family 2 protein [Ignavibacteriales bacterium]